MLLLIGVLESSCDSFLAFSLINSSKSFFLSSLVFNSSLVDSSSLLVDSPLFFPLSF